MKLKRLGQNVRDMVLRRGILISYPKSGRTWLRVMLEKSGIVVRYTHLGATLSVGRESSELRFRLPYPGRVLGLVRDPRDTLVSSYYQATRRGDYYSGDISDFVRDPRFGIEKIALFNLLLRDHCASHPQSGLLLTYEGLVADTAGQLQRAAAFLRYRLDATAAAEIAASCSFSVMQAQERSGALGALHGGSLTPRDASDTSTFKVRRGKIGGYVDELSPSDIDYAEDVLKKLDYQRLIDSVTER